VTSAGFRPEFFDELAALEAGNFWFRSRNALILAALRRHFRGMRSFLEVGCGTGYVLSAVAEAFPAARVVGNEVFSAGLAHARRRLPHVELLEMDARQMAYDGVFDAAGAFDVIEHIDDDEQVLARLGRAVVPGGGLLLTVPQHPWLWSEQDDLACHVRRYSASGLRRKVEAAGFEVVDLMSFVSLLLPLMWLSRRLRRSNGAGDALADLRLRGWQNQALGAVMAVERLLLGAGVRFPIGGSLLLVARKRLVHDSRRV
jgi:SAM-dependent methyltransferase